MKNPVIIKKIYPTSKSETVQVLLTQESPRPVTSGSGLLSLTMKGHSAFKTPSRSAFQNFSTAALEEYGLVEGSVLPEDWNADLIIREFTAGEKFDEIDLQFVTSGATHFVPWVSGEKVQEPKRAGADGDYLLIDGKEIYRNTYLSVKGMPKEDKLIQHNGQKISSQEGVNTESKVGNIKL